MGKYLLFLLICLNIHINIVCLQLPLLQDNNICEDHDFSPLKEYVKITGRYYQRRSMTWIVYSGSAIEFYATGNYVELSLVGDDNIYQEEEYLPRYAIYVDDKVLIDTKMNDLEYNIQFKINEESERTKIKIMLLSEAQNGGIGIKNIKINSCATFCIIEPVEEKKLRIEFIGDSITCAYGVDAPNQTFPFTTTTENFSKSYAYLASQILDADYSVVALSGHGIVSGYSNGDKWADGIMSLYYEKISKNSEYPGNWDFRHNRNDVILINLGTNDANYVNADREKRRDEFVQEYGNFLKLVRSKNPDSYIICTLGTLNPKDMFELVEEAIKLFGDNKVSYFESPVQDMNDGLGADWHPSQKTHEKLAKLVAEKIKAVIELYNI